MTINNYNSYVLLESTDISNIATHEIVTGGTSSAVGLVVYPVSIVNGGRNTGGLFQAGSTNSIVKLASYSNSNNDHYNSYGIRITGNGSGTGTPVGEVAIITDYVGSTKLATVVSAFSIPPDTQNNYVIDEVLTVALISGNFTSGGETITNQDGDSCVLTSAKTFTPDGTLFPANSILVTGDNTASDDIYRDIRNAFPAIATDPSATDQALTLDATVDIGRKDEASVQTEILTKNEIVRINFGLFLNGNASYKTEYTSGEANYKDDDIANFPPISAFRGTKIIMGVDCYSNLQTCFSDEDSNVFLYNSTFETDKATYAWNLQFRGVVLSSDVLFDTISISYFFNAGCKFNEFVAYGCQAILPAVGGIEWTDCTFNSPIRYAFFIVGYFESEVTDTAFLDNGIFVGAFLADFFLTLKNCEVDVFSFFAFAVIKLSDEKTFDLTVVDGKDNPIENVNVRLKDKYGYSLLFDDTGETMDTPVLLYNTTSVLVSDYTKFSVDDVIRVDLERMTVTAASSNPITVTRGVQGTSAFQITNGDNNRRIFKQVDTIQTASTGKITQYSVARFNRRLGGGTAWSRYFGPCTLEMSKSGYKPYESPISFGSNDSDVTYKTDNQDLTIKLEPNRFIEQRSIG